MWSAVIGGLFLWVFTFLSALVGMVIFAYYTNIGCDPVQVSENKLHLKRSDLYTLGHDQSPKLLFSMFINFIAGD